MRLHIPRSWVLLIAIAIALGTFGCGGSNTPVGPTSSESSGSGGSGSSGNSVGSGSTNGGSGHLMIGITDSPFSDAKAVLITFDGISVHTSGQGWQTIGFANGATERTCDLKKLQGPTDVLGSTSLPAGHYTQIRLQVRSATIHFDNASNSATACAPSITVPGTRFANVRVPSGEVILNREFTIDAGGTVTMVLDFDGDKSIRQQGGGGNGNGNGNGGNGNGNGNGNGGGTSAPEDGSYSLQPVVSIVSVTAQ
jgi:uncharacterized protein DUF4382